jgi:hypothetical protein
MSAAEKKKKSKKKAAGTGGAVVPLLKAEGPTDMVELSLSWEGGAAALASLTDNGDPVDFGREQGVGEAGLNLRWRSPDAFIHVLQWDLWFLGTRTNLKAKAKINSTGGFVSPVASKTQEGRWSASGAAE